MKQKEIYIDLSLNLETQKMVEMYFAIKTVSGIEGFVYSGKEFLKKYKNAYSFENFRKAKLYAIYEVDQCEICGNSFDLIINNRPQLYQLLSRTSLTCNRCTIYQSSIENAVGINFR